jgi:hypothetical protein
MAEFARIILDQQFQIRENAIGVKHKRDRHLGEASLPE